MTMFLTGCGKKKSIFEKLTGFSFILKAVKIIVFLLILALLLKAVNKVVSASKKVVNTATSKPVEVAEEPRQGQEPRQVDRVKDSSNWD